MRYPIILAVAAFGSVCALWNGYESGQKILSEADYRNGKAALELLEAASHSDTHRRDLLVRDAQDNLTKLSSKAAESGLLQTLYDYQGAIYVRDNALLKERAARLKGEIAYNRATSLRLRTVAVDIEAREARLALREVTSIEPIVKLCHDDAAQYFDLSVPATNACHSMLQEHRATFYLLREAPDSAFPPNRKTAITN